MISRWIGVGLLALAPVTTLAFETVDEIPFPSTGAFPAWGGDPIAPLTVFAYGGLMYDSNAFRRDTNAESDIVARYGAGARYLARVVGRQRVRLEGFGEYYDYDQFSEIDHFGYGMRGELLFEIGNQVNGAASYTRRRRHAELGEFRVERRTMVTLEQYILDGGYRFAPNWRVFGAFDGTRARRETDDAADLDTNTLRASLTYSTPLANAIGVEVRGTRGDARFEDAVTGVAFTNDYEERELSAVLAYALGAQLRVSGRVGRTEREYEDLEGRNFSGTTYRGVVDWLPTGKLTFTFEAFRVPSSVIDIDSSHVLRIGTGFGAAYAATFKLVFSARFLNEHRLNQGSAEAELLGIAARDETLRTWRFAVGWEPRRHWQLGAGVDLGERSSNTLGRDYDYQQVMLNARFVY